MGLIWPRRSILKGISVPVPARHGVCWPNSSDPASSTGVQPLRRPVTPAESHSSSDPGCWDHNQAAAGNVSGLPRGKFSLSSRLSGSSLSNPVPSLCERAVRLEGTSVPLPQASCAAEGAFCTKTQRLSFSQAALAAPLFASPSLTLPLLYLQTLEGMASSCSYSHFQQQLLLDLSAMLAGLFLLYSSCLNFFFPFILCFFLQREMVLVNERRYK